MISHATDIMNDLLQCLRDSQLFAEVSIGHSGMQTAVPRATILHEGEEFFRADDSATSRQVRLSLRLIVHTRPGHAADTLTRADELMHSAIAAILIDPYRAGLCQDLPIGQACEIENIDQANASDKKSRPEFELAANLRFHYESPN
jgi:hypothetical protein